MTNSMICTLQLGTQSIFTKAFFLTSFCSYPECISGEDYGYLKVNVKLKFSILHMGKCLFRSLERCISLTNIT